MTTPATIPPPLVSLFHDWFATLVIGFLVTSYWRGTWVLFDIWLCDMPAEAGMVTGDSFCFAGLIGVPEFSNESDQRLKSAWISAGIGVGLTAVGVMCMWMGWWRPPVTGLEKKVYLPWKTVIVRFFIIYTLGMAAVNLWRGIWYLTDAYLLPNTLTTNEWGDWTLTSFWVSSVVGSTVCFLFWAGASILAPPGIFLMDGPGVNPPPIAVTLMSCYYSLTLPAGVPPPEIPTWQVMVDVLLSYLGIPIMVVWYWRGSWLVMDYYLYGFSPNHKDVYLSIAWSTIMALGLLFLTSETVFAHISVKNKIIKSLLGRLRTYLLAWGVVNWWRAVWLVWDEFLGGTTQWSAWISHAVAIIVLTVFGCLSCILAPASTLGMDLLPHPEAAEEPLFANLPVPVNDLSWLAIGRQPRLLDPQKVPSESTKSQRSFVRSSVLGVSVTELEMTGITTEEADEEFMVVPTDQDTALKSNQAMAIWSSGSTGRRGVYSSVRPRGEVPRHSYLDRQRPDLDLRVSRSSTLSSLTSAGISVRSESDFYRSR